jgi:hypothetical protein
MSILVKSRPPEVEDDAGREFSTMRKLSAGEAAIEAL